MPVFLSSAVLLFGSLLALQQAPATGTPGPAQEMGSYKSDLGFSYTYPSDWESLDTKPMAPAARQQTEEKAASGEEKQAAGCLEFGLLAKHGTPSSIMMTVAVPTSCYGTAIKQSDLPGLGEGVSSGMKRSFDLKDSIYGAYKIGSHDMWIERASGHSKEHPEADYTIETVCGVLQKGVVCWIGLMKDDASLKVFEQGQVTLESDGPAALVPANAFGAAKQ